MTPPMLTVFAIGATVLSAPAGGSNRIAAPFTGAAQALEVDRRPGPPRQGQTGAGGDDRWPPDLPTLPEVIPGLPGLPGTLGPGEPRAPDGPVDLPLPLLRMDDGRLPPARAPSRAEGEPAPGRTYDCALETGFEEPGRRTEVYRERWKSTTPDCGSAIERHWEWELWQRSDDPASVLPSGEPLGPQHPEATGRDVGRLGPGPGLRRGRRRGSLGIQVREHDGVVLVVGIVSPGPAAAAGMQAGDVIKAYAGRPVRNAAHFENLVSHTSPGTRVEVDVVRPHRRATLAITIGSFDTDPVRW